MAEAMPLAGVVVNRVRHTRTSAVSVDSATSAAEELRARAESSNDGDRLLAAAELLDVHADIAAEARRHERLTNDFAARHPAVPLVRVPIAATDVHDLDGLRGIGTELARVSRERAEAQAALERASVTRASAPGQD
ncbi:hypothetical protein GCM10025883_03210 [Mobilicoccus caccae]|uniref:Anion-transporting ATPase-like domain-containing protein n=1 Tax=Mobilicoccus caccae TaxID=1859295 RepID=A0ABQ6IKK6_9MICO|nr:hypothetical protein GCM10025883_03210 [Mobilicoccus caccae]